LALERKIVSYDFRSYLQVIRKDLEMQGYAVAFKVNDQKTVRSAFIRFIVRFST